METLGECDGKLGASRKKSGQSLKPMYHILSCGSSCYTPAPGPGTGQGHLVGVPLPKAGDLREGILTAPGRCRSPGQERLVSR